MREHGLTLMIFGIVITLVGFLLTTGVKIPLLGRLPGDIYINRENFKFFFPITSSILVSIILTFVINLFKK